MNDDYKREETWLLGLHHVNDDDGAAIELFASDRGDEKGAIAEAVDLIGNRRDLLVRVVRGFNIYHKHYCMTDAEIAEEEAESDGIAMGAAGDSDAS